MAALELGKHVHAVDGAAEAGVQPVEVWSLAEGDEELRAAGVWIAGVSHAQAALKMGPMAGARLLTKNSVHRAAGAVALWIAALSHEALEHAMKVQRVVEALVHEARSEERRVGEESGRGGIAQGV